MQKNLQTAFCKTYSPKNNADIKTSKRFSMQWRISDYTYDYCFMRPAAMEILMIFANNHGNGFCAAVPLYNITYYVN